MTDNAATAKIFISYRRADSADITGRVYDSLAQHFGKAAIFKDVDNIPFGADFPRHLETILAQCVVELVLIGPRWLEISDAKGRRLDDPEDFVRLEVERGLSRDILVIPLLVTGATMPSADQLPPGLAELVRRNAVPVRSDPDFHKDMGRLIRQLEGYVPPMKKPPPAVPLQRPPRATHFTGREKELKALLAQLQPGQVVTLCGPGGVGKTALAAEAIWTLAPGDDPPERFPDGIIFHTFYNQPQAALALEAIARAYGEEPKPTPRDAAARALSRRTALLVLDGAETADDLQAVLSVAGRCGVLVTTRRHTDALADWEDVAPLPNPQAVELLQAWGGDRAADEAAAQRICTLLGALPLAVRLAGRYMAQRGEEAADYLAWLEETPLRALDHGQRQQDSVPLLLRCSLGQVSEGARDALGVVGILALDPFSRDVVAAAQKTSPREASRALGELVDYGLLLRSKERYRPSHALVHTYARRRLAPPSEVIGRLAAYYDAFAREQSQLGLEGYARLDDERPHLMALLTGCVDRQAWEESLSLAWAISGHEGYLDIQGHWTERVTALLAGLAAARALKRRYDEEAHLGHLGITFHSVGQVARSIEYHQQALAIAREIGDRRNEGAWLGNLGLAYADLGESRRAIECYEQALAIAREIGDRRSEGNHLGNLGLAYAALGEVRQAIEYHDQALAISREIGDRHGEGNHLGNLGLAYADLGEVRRAIEFYEQALAIAREIGDRVGEGATLGNLGNAYARLGEARRAIEYYEQSLAISREIGDRRAEGTTLGDLGIAYRNLGEPRRAIEYHQQALTISREIGDRHGEGNHLGSLGAAYTVLGEARRAIEFYEQALAISREIGDRHGEGTHLGNLGIAYGDLGEARRAIEFYEQALAIAREIGDRRAEGADLGNLGIAYRNLGEARRAIEFYEQALAISREIGDRRAEGDHLGSLGLAYHALGEPRQAIEYHQQALAISREIGDQRGEGTTLGSLGLAYRALGEARRAIEFYEQALAIAREIGDRRNEGTWFGNLGIAYADLGEAPRAIEFYEQALAISREIGDRRGEALHSWNLGLLYEETDPARAVELMSIYVAYEREIGHPEAETHAESVAQIQARL
jgi:tetratricopeptide (TPR) repeat protein